MIGGKTIWHFQIFQDGMRRQKQYRQHVVPHVVPEISRSRNRQRVALLAAPEISQSRNRQHVVLPVEQAINNRPLST